jgi:uncharacterized protein (DUF885 family)
LQDKASVVISRARYGAHARGTSMSTKWILTAVLCSSSLVASAANPARPTAAAVEGELTSTYFQWFPEMATYYSVDPAVAGPGSNTRLSPRTQPDEVAKRAALRRVLSRFGEADVTGLSQADQVFHAALEATLRGSLAPAEVVEYGTVFSAWGMWFMPYAVSQIGGPQDLVTKLLDSQQPVRNAAEAEDYLTRLGAYATTIDETIAKIEHDRRLGVVPPGFVLEKAIATLAPPSDGDPAQHPLVVALATKARAAGLSQPDAWTKRASALVTNGVLPANARLAAKLQSMRAGASDEPGIWRLPQGDALYQAMILHMTDTALSPRKIHDLGLAEVARILGEMDTILRAEGYTEGSVGKRMETLNGEKRFMYSNDADGKARLLADVNAQLAEIAPLLPRWFGTLPPQQVVVKAVPAQSEGGSTGGFYDAPALDGSRPGTYWINLRDLALWPSFKLKTLTYHEGNPGHHLQTAFGMGVGTPVIATALYSNAFGEGWGLYAEALAHEMGLYAKDPYGDLGRLQDELWRAVRLVVDTGMHSLRWSRAQAIDYAITTAGVHPLEAEAEVDRYAVWPGQALGYKIGMLEIQRLRRVAQEALGDRFDIRAFHVEVLKDGAVPLQVLETKIQRWIATQRTPADAFVAAISQHCGKAYAGRITAIEPAAPNDPFADKPLVMHVLSCSPQQLRIPFHVGDDHSRTWVVTRTASGLQLKHDHRHADGSPDVLTMYGGDTTMAGTAERQEFPVDAESRAMFEKEGSKASVTNTWAMEIEPAERFVYELARPGRLFRVEFDLTQPVATPPMPWGTAAAP